MPERRNIETSQAGYGDKGSLGKIVTIEEAQHFLKQYKTVGVGKAIGLLFSMGNIKAKSVSDGFCAACGKDMIDPKTGTLLVGVSLELNINDHLVSSKGFIKKQFGKYQDNIVYNICWECWLKSLGVKPKEE